MLFLIVGADQNLGNFVSFRCGWTEDLTFLRWCNLLLRVRLYQKIENWASGNAAVRFYSAVEIISWMTVRLWVTKLANSDIWLCPPEICVYCIFIMFCSLLPLNYELLFLWNGHAPLVCRVLNFYVTGRAHFFGVNYSLCRKCECSLKTIFPSHDFFCWRHKKACKG